jgi:hypothetical protein
LGVLAISVSIISLAIGSSSTTTHFNLLLIFYGDF